MVPLWRRCFAEAIGTFALVFAGCGAVVVNGITSGALGHIGVSVVFGLVVAVMIYAVGNVSGAHFNPAVTIGFCVARRFPARDAAAYVVVQCVAAIVAALALRMLFEPTGDLGATLPAKSVAQAFALEVILTAILFFVILNVSTGAMEKGIMAGAAIGGTVVLAALFGGPISGASMNPARSLGPALASGQLQHLWVYLVAPVVGALIASPSCRITQGPQCCHIPFPEEDEK